MNAPEIDRLIDLMARLPGLGPRSAKRAVLHLLKQRSRLMDPLARALADAAANVTQCSVCGNLDARDPCTVCQKASTGGRDSSLICVVEDVADLWALERAGIYRGLYHVLGGVLNALDGVGPDDLNLAGLVDRARNPDVKEVILALNATVDGQTTAHYVASQLETADVKLTGLAQGVPLGGELDYLDDGTLAAALKARKDI